MWAYLSINATHVCKVLRQLCRLARPGLTLHHYELPSTNSLLKFRAHGQSRESTFQAVDLASQGSSGPWNVQAGLSHSSGMIAWCFVAELPIESKENDNALGKSM